MQRCTALTGSVSLSVTVDTISSLWREIKRNRAATERQSPSGLYRGDCTKVISCTLRGCCVDRAKQPPQLCPIYHQPPQVIAAREKAQRGCAPHTSISFLSKHVRTHTCTFTQAHADTFFTLPIHKKYKIT